MTDTNKAALVQIIRPEYPMAYSHLVACIKEAKAHLDNGNNQACWRALDRADTVILEQERSMCVVS